MDAELPYIVERLHIVLTLPSGSGRKFVLCVIDRKCFKEWDYVMLCIKR